MTSQSRYAELLGLKKIVGPLEVGKATYDQEYGAIATQIDRAVIELEKLKTITPEEMAVLLNTNIKAPAHLGEKEKKHPDQ